MMGPARSILCFGSQKKLYCSLLIEASLTLDVVREVLVRIMLDPLELQILADVISSWESGS